MFNRCLICNLGVFDIEVQDFEVQVINDVIIMLYQIVYVFIGSSQWSVVSIIDRQYYIVVSFMQSFDFVVLSVILYIVSGILCRQIGVCIFIYYKCQCEVVDVMIFSQCSQIWDCIQCKVDIWCINVFWLCFFWCIYVFFGFGLVNKNMLWVVVRRRNFLYFILRNVVYIVKVNQCIVGIKCFWIKLWCIIQFFVVIVLSFI